MSTLELPRGTTATESVATKDDEQVITTPRSTALALGPLTLTFEQGLYLLLGVLSLLAHLWALGDRALHHDETLHAAYSWNLFTGQGYIHDPLLHGPFLYHLGALQFFLFGDNDFTARLSAALFGVVLTLLPYLLRRELGRPAALLASIYLLISPAFLYVGRFFRHDIYSIVFELLVFIAIVRYASTRQARWLYIGAAAFGLMAVNQETSYLFSLIFGAPLLLLLLWRLFKPGILLLGALALSLATLIFVLPGSAQVDGAHNAIRDPQTGQMQYEPGPIFGWYPLETYDNSYALRVRNRADNDGGRSLVENLLLYLADLGKFFGHPAVLIGMGLTVAILAALIWAIWWRRAADGLTPWQRAREHNDAIIAPYATLSQDRRWLIAIGIVLGIYTLFFTAFFTNLLGFITGTTGSLLYWLAQHNVERGGQPGHYYTVLLVIYEPLLLLWFGVGLVILARDLFARRQHLFAAFTPQNGADAVPASPPPLPFAVYLLAWWSLAAFGIYTWAGEKMPWLVVHIALPMAIFAAWSAGRVLWPAATDAASTPAPAIDPPRVRMGLIYASVFTVIVSFSYVLMNAYINVGTAAPLPFWMIGLFSLLLVGLLTLAMGLYLNWQRALGMLAICVTILGCLYTVRNSYRLNYLSGDVPREMLIYTQTSPDVMRVVRRLEEASRRRGGGLTMPVIYDNETVWSWYMRDFTRATRTGPQLSAPVADDVQAVLMLQENFDRFPQNQEYLRGFRIQRYPLRWWFPESELYRLNDDWRTAPPEQVSLLGRVLRAPFDNDTAIDLWNFLLRRDTGVPLGSSDFIVAVRPELADQIGYGLGGTLEPASNSANSLNISR